MLPWWAIVLIVLGVSVVMVGLGLLALYVYDVYRDNRLIRLVRDIKERPLEPFVSTKGDGIVVIAGGPVYGPLALRLVQRLDALGSQLPLEVWALDATELTDPSMVTLSQHPRVVLKDISVHMKDLRASSKRITGYRSKSIALYHSAFRRVMLLDADNFPLQCPDALFDLPEFDTAVIWPDIEAFDSKLTVRWAKIPFKTYSGVILPRISHVERLMRRMGLEQVHCRPQFESGQLLMDREKCWPALRLIKGLNEAYNVTYDVLMGDKDTYAMGLEIADVPYYAVPFRPGLLGRVHSTKGFRGVAYVQRHPVTGEASFAHFVGLAQKVTGVERTCDHIMFPRPGAVMQKIVDNKTKTVSEQWWSQGDVSDYVVH